MVQAKYSHVDANEVLLTQDEFLLCFESKDVFKQLIRINDPSFDFTPPVVKAKILHFCLNYSYQEELQDESQIKPQWLPKIDFDVSVHLDMHNPKDALMLYNFKDYRIEKLSMQVPNFKLESQDEDDNLFDRFINGLKLLRNLWEVTIRLRGENMSHTFRGDHSSIVNSITSYIEGTYETTIEDRILFIDYK